VLKVVNSIKRFFTILILLIAVAIVTVVLYRLYVAAPITEHAIIYESIGIAIIIGFWAAIFTFIRRSRPLMEHYLGEQATTILNIFLGAITIIVMVLAVLNTLGASAQTLLTGAGFASITIGLIISTFVGGLLAGALVFSTHRFRVGDTVIVNNIPGTVTELTALVTRITTDTGLITIPNSAISSGGVVITKVHKFDPNFQSRLPYVGGDRVITSYMVGEGTVKSLTALRTVILLDSGREITLLNSSVLSGGVAVAKLSGQSNVPAKSA
jgi:small-conductance mechanosensitive channel